MTAVWRIEFAGSARKTLSKLGPSVSKRVTDYLEERVAEDPRSKGRALERPLKILWRYRVGDYRILCDLQDDRIRVLVVKIGDRKDVYR